jgi:hypothetical protein
MATMTDDTRDRVIATEVKVENLTRIVNEMKETLDALYEKSKEQEGMLKAGRLTVGAIGALGGMVMTIIFKLLPFTHSLPK